MCSLQWLHNQNKQYTCNNAKYNDVVIPYNYTEYSDNYSNISGYVSLVQCCRDKPAANSNGVFVSFDVWLILLIRLILRGETVNNGTKYVEIMKPLKCVSNPWRTLEMPWLIVKLILFWLGLKIVL